MKKFSEFISHIEEKKVIDKDVNSIEEKPISIKEQLPKKKVVPTRKQLSQPSQPVKEKYSIVDKIAQFSFGFKPSEAYKLLESTQVSKDSLYYMISEQPNNSLLIVKYNENAGPDLKEFIISLMDFYKKNNQLKSLTEKIKVDGNKVFTIIKDIPSKEFMKIINSDITNLLNDFKK